MMWPGSHYGCTHRPDVRSSGSVNNRIRESLMWFRHRSKPANLVMLHIPDFGPVFRAHGTQSGAVS